MKILKKGILILSIPLITFKFSNAQVEQPKMFVMQTDNLKFEMTPTYKELAIKFKQKCEENGMKDMTCTTITFEDNHVVHVSSIKNVTLPTR